MLHLLQVTTSSSALNAPIELELPNLTKWLRYGQNLILVLDIFSQAFSV